VTTTADGERIVTVAVRNDKAFVQVFDLGGSQLLFPLAAPQFAGQEGVDVRINALAFAGAENGADILIAGARGQSIPQWAIKVPPFEPWAEASATPIDTGLTETDAVASDASGRVVVLAGDRKVVFRIGGARVDGNEALPGTANDAAISPNGATAVVASDNGVLTIWDTASGRQIKAIQAHNGEAWSVAFDASGTVFASGGSDDVIHVWNADGSARAQIKRKGVDATALAYHGDGTLFAGDSTGRVERMEASGHVLTSAQLFRDESVNQIVVNPAGDTVFVAGPPGIRVLDSVSGSILSLRFPRVAESIQALALRKDGALLAGATAKGEVLLWRSDWKAWLTEACDRLADHAVFRSLSGPVAGAVNINTHGVNYAAAYQSCQDHATPAGTRP